LANTIPPGELVKKIALIAMALIASLGLAGAAYAMWFDTVVVKGTVTTADIDLNVTAYSKTYVWKTVINGLRVTYSSLPPADYPAAIDAFPNDGQSDIDPLAFASAEQAGDDNVILTYSNLFPLEIEGDYGYCAGFGGTYDGTVPVHIGVQWSITPPIPGWATVLMNNHAAIEIRVNNILIPEPNWADIQLHQGDTYYFKVCVYVPQTWGAGDSPLSGSTSVQLDGQSFSLTGKIVAYQWNEEPILLP
jgi:hypothetical protein